MILFRKLSLLLLVLLATHSAWAARARIVKDAGLYQRNEKGVRSVGKVLGESEVDVLRTSENGKWVEIQQGDLRGWIAADRVSTAEAGSGDEPKAWPKRPESGEASGMAFEPSIAYQADVGLGLGGGLFYRSLSKSHSGPDVGAEVQYFAFHFAKPIEYELIFRYWIGITSIMLGSEVYLSGRSLLGIVTDSTLSIAPGFGLQMGLPVSRTTLIRAGIRYRLASDSDLTFSAGLGFLL